MADVRTLNAIMLTDMVGYTRLSQQNEALALALVEEQHGLLLDVVGSHGGRAIKNTGDGLLAVFPSALQAVTAAIAVQRRLHDRNHTVETERRFQIRIGLHIGDVVHRENDIFGDGVNITSRIEPLAEPGGICLSEAAYAQIRNKIDRPMISLGQQQLKNVEYPMEVYRLLLPWDEAPEAASAARPERTRLAVLPLTGTTAEPEDAYFADGMTEELIYTLSKVKGLRVIAHTSTLAYRGTSKTARQIGQDLGVGSIVEGSVRRHGDRIRITVQLVDTETEEHLWADRYDRQLADVLDIQSEIAEDVASGLKLLLERQPQQAARKPTTDVEAYTAYLKGRHFWQRRTRRGLEQAIEAFEQAIDKDPTFAKAYSGLADAYSVMANLGYRAPDVALRHAQSAAEKAVALDPDLAEAHASLGLSDIQFRSDTEAAERRFLRALELNPSYASAHLWYSGVLYVQNRMDEALHHARKAAELDPRTPIVLVNVGNLLLERGAFEEAKTYFEQAIESEPSFEGAYADLAKTQAILWDWHGAQRTLQEALARNPDNASALAAQAILFLIVGQGDDAARSMQQAKALGPTQFSVREPLARYHRYLGQTDEAIAIYLEAAAEQPENPIWQMLIAFALIEGHQLEAAARVLGEMDVPSSHVFPRLRPYIRYAQAILAALRGERDDALQQVRAVVDGDDFLERMSAQTLVHALLGEIDAAFTYLDQAVAVHDPWLPQITVDPLAAPLRSDPRYARVLAVLGLAQAD